MLGTEKSKELREQLADLCHKQWLRWAMVLLDYCKNYGDGQLIIPPWIVDRWKTKIDYKHLSENEKDFNRKEADKIIELLNGRDK